MKINKTLTICSGLLAIGLTTQAQNITESTSSSSSWLGAPVFETGTTPQGGNGGTTEDNDSWGGNANGTAGFGDLAESFEVSSSGTLGSAELVLAGSAATFNVELYNLGSASSLSYPGTVGGAAPITQINNIGGGGSGGVSLLQSGDNFTFAGVGSGADVVTLTFVNADSDVPLVAGDVYVLSLDPTANADGTWWERGGVPTTQDDGEGLNADGVSGDQNFEGKSSIRDFDTAVTEAPEPASLALFGLGGLAVAYMIRRRKA